MAQIDPLVTLLAEAASPMGVLTYKQYVQITLYAPELGYYCQKKERVGKGIESDFYTAKTVSPLFEKLVIEAAAKLLHKNIANETTFVEIGAEPNQPDWGRHSPFKAHCSVRLGDEYPWEEKQHSTPYVVFANEVLDAQPFDRIRFMPDGWQQMGVAIDLAQKNPLSEVTLGPALPYSGLPQSAPIGYTIDVPTGALAWVKKLAETKWNGLLILIDYGKTWDQITHECSEGTARTYFRHKQGGDLLQNPGQCDITHDIAWDWIESALKENGFTDVERVRQEAFFVKHASRLLEEVFTDPKAPLEDKAALKALLHPGHFGSRFQVLTAKRGI